MDRLRRVLVGAAATACAALLSVTPVLAHEEGGVALAAIVEEVTPTVPGLSVTALRSVAPLLELRNGSGREIVVLGERGEPMLRFSGDAVEANLRSATYRASVDPYVVLEPGPMPVGLPSWRLLDGAPEWRWFDPRLRVEPLGVAVAFRIELLVDGEAVLVRGTVHPGEIGHFRTTLEAPRDPQLEARVLEGPVPALYVANHGPSTLEIDGLEGEPYLRIGPEGVHANTASPTYRRLATGGAGSDSGSARPVWVQLSPHPVWSWLEFRARVPGRGVRAFDLGSRPATVLRWVTPMRLGGRDVALAGKVDWLPLEEGGARLGPWHLGAAAAAVLLLQRRYVHRVPGSPVRRGASDGRGPRVRPAAADPAPSDRDHRAPPRSFPRPSRIRSRPTSNCSE